MRLKKYLEKPAKDKPSKDCINSRLNNIEVSLYINLSMR